MTHSPKSLSARLLRLFIVCGVAVVLFVLLLASSQRFLLFPTYAIPDTYQQPAPSKVEVIWHERDGDKIEVWFVPGTGDLAKKPVVFFAHGNGMVIDHYPDRLLYSRLGYHVVLIEYRGYGRTLGSPSEDAIVADFVSVYDRILKRPDVDKKNIVFHGQSLGGGVVGSVARQRLPSQLILESTFSSVPDIADTVIPFSGYLIVDEFETAEFLKTAEIPVLVIHGTDDHVVPYTHGQALKNAAKNARLVTIERGRHMLRWNKHYVENVTKFLQERRDKR